MQALAQLLVGLLGLFVFVWAMGPLWAVVIGVGWVLIKLAGGNGESQ